MRIGVELVVQGSVTLWRPIEPGLTVVGQNPECDLCLPMSGIAGVQCVLRREGLALFVDNRHVEGTRVGGELVRESLQLANGDEIVLGPVTARVSFLNTDSAASRTRTLEFAHEKRPPALFLTVASAPPDKRWAITRAGLTVGVDPKNDVVLDDPFASTFHARFSLEAGRCIVRDLDSRNGVFAGEQKIREGEVRPGASVRLGKTTLVVTTGDREETIGPDGDRAHERLIGASKGIERVRELTRRLANADASVLILGETGTGKEVVARLLHEQSRRATRAFVAINCGALSKGLIESELFGHEKGAFTGAVAQKPGAFEAADRGTLFLDEIGELPLELQPQLLRAFETGEIRRVGATTPFVVNVRILAATNRRLADEVAAGRFREDLFHRLHVLTIELPALSDRPGDIAALAQHFLASFAPAGRPLRLAAPALARLNEHPWPGNVRELRNVIQRAVLLRRSDVIDVDDISFTPGTLTTRVQTESATSCRTLSEIERDAVISELRRHRGNKKEAAAALGVSRSTIHRKIEELAINLDEILGERSVHLDR